MNNIAVIAAHADDEALGCGGTIAKLSAEGFSVHLLLLADGESARDNSNSEEHQKAVAARKNAALKSAEILGIKDVEVHALPDNRLDSCDLLDVIKIIEKFIEKHSPEIVFTHHFGDVNIDHRIVHDAVIAATRPQPGHGVRKLILFETLSSTEWRPSTSSMAFLPNYYVDINTTLELKIAALTAYDSEMRAHPHPRSYEGVRILANWRGLTVGLDAAEAFVIAREIIR